MIIIDVSYDRNIRFTIKHEKHALSFTPVKPFITQSQQPVTANLWRAYNTAASPACS